MIGIMLIMIGKKIILLKNVFLIYNDSKYYFLWKKT
jgi:hypothetical protein